jgi:hypothetical protein
VRTELSRPLVVALESWLRKQRARVSKNSETGKAIDYSLKRWVALNDIDPQAWLADVLARVLDYPAKRIGDLLPWNWHAERRAAAA